MTKRYRILNAEIECTGCKRIMAQHENGVYCNNLGCGQHLKSYKLPSIELQLRDD